MTYLTLLLSFYAWLQQWQWGSYSLPLVCPGIMLYNRNITLAVVILSIATARKRFSVSASCLPKNNDVMIYITLVVIILSITTARVRFSPSRTCLPHNNAIYDRHHSGGCHSIYSSSDSEVLTVCLLSAQILVLFRYKGETSLWLLSLYLLQQREWGFYSLHLVCVRRML